jgi:hypothetical protein
MPVAPVDPTAPVELTSPLAALSIEINMLLVVAILTVRDIETVDVTTGVDTNKLILPQFALTATTLADQLFITIFQVFWVIVLVSVSTVSASERKQEWFSPNSIRTSKIIEVRLP